MWFDRYGSQILISNVNSLLGTRVKNSFVTNKISVLVVFVKVKNKIR
ncbi:hypothetical protein VTH8203_02826 [Vibrio thalassae]|uniref:Uncharacterized protein n=1 Tax=Vibrio thalassae TaxID=1243014 RepID=A0A240ELQ2_9VIBR|nr:hypothetical protein VTH8203_02826 [Vibrio thalassae]